MIRQLDILSRSILLEAALGLEEGTYSSDPREGLRKIRTNHPNLHDAWHSFDSSGVYDHLLQILKPYDNGEDLLQRALMGLGVYGVKIKNPLRKVGASMNFRRALNAGRSPLESLERTEIARYLLQKAENERLKRENRKRLLNKKHETLVNGISAGTFLLDFLLKSTSDLAKELRALMQWCWKGDSCEETMHLSWEALQEGQPLTQVELAEKRGMSSMGIGLQRQRGWALFALALKKSPLIQKKLEALLLHNGFLDALGTWGTLGVEAVVTRRAPPPPARGSRTSPPRDGMG